MEHDGWGTLLTDTYLSPIHPAPRLVLISCPPVSRMHCTGHAVERCCTSRSLSLLRLGDISRTGQTGAGTVSVDQDGRPESWRKKKLGASLSPCLHFKRQRTLLPFTVFMSRPFWAGNTRYRERAALVLEKASSRVYKHVT